MSGAIADVRQASCTSTSAPAARSRTSSQTRVSPEITTTPAGRGDPVRDRFPHRFVVDAHRFDDDRAVVAAPDLDRRRRQRERPDVELGRAVLHVLDAHRDVVDERVEHARARSGSTQPSTATIGSGPAGCSVPWTQRVMTTSARSTRWSLCTWVTNSASSSWRHGAGLGQPQHRGPPGVELERGLAVADEDAGPGASRRRVRHAGAGERDGRRGHRFGQRVRPADQRVDVELRVAAVQRVRRRRQADVLERLARVGDELRGRARPAGRRSRRAARRVASSIMRKWWVKSTGTLTEREHPLVVAGRRRTCRSRTPGPTPGRTP